MRLISNNLESDDLALSDAVTKEWVITNGLGGFSSSTICGLNQRKYHGLLIAAMTPPTSRRVLVSRLEEIAYIDGCEYNLSIIQYKNHLQAGGYSHYKEFKRTPFPKYIFEIDGVKITKEIIMPQGENSVYVRYKNLGDKKVTLKVRPFLVNRDYHSLSKSEELPHSYTKNSEYNITFINKHYDQKVHFQWTKGQFEEEYLLFENIEYLTEQSRGHAYSESNEVLGYIETELSAGEKLDLAFSAEEEFIFSSYKKIKTVEKKRLKSLAVGYTDQFLKDLIISSDQFIVDRKSVDSKSVIAGYHWFSDWGRDTMIAIRGLGIAVGKQAMCKDIITTFLHYLSDGMIPNRFPDYDEPPVYNTIDATLWTFIALYDYDKKFNDKAFIEGILSKLRSIILYHQHGTRYNIHTTQHGFVFAGDKSTQLTWMDAIYGDHAFTPRWGCAVEINVLWYNALKIYNHFVEKYNHGTKDFTDLISKLETTIPEHFFNGEYMNDLVNPPHWIDDSIRPNQIYAVSLPFSPLTEEQQLKVVTNVEEELFTPFGLRTLAPSHPDFKADYNGGQWTRDEAYHQGTAWPFLVGEYYSAYLKVHSFSDEAIAYVHEHIEYLKEHFYHENGIYAISEIFDGGEPALDNGKGCIQQAWSVSQLIKVLIEITETQSAK